MKEKNKCIWKSHGLYYEQTCEEELIKTWAPPNRRSGVMYIEGPRACDCCDQEKDCASIDIGLVNFVWVLCEDCLQEFIYEFYDEKEVMRMKRKKKLENLEKNEKCR